MVDRAFRLSVPASSANIGPGFDVLGLGLALFLELTVSIDSSKTGVVITYEGEGAENVPLEPDHNLITRTALYVMRCNSVRDFPEGTSIHVKNPIPLGRGLGSSGAAVVAGVMLGNEIGNFNFSKHRLLDYCLMIERHPDNVTAAMIGGFVGSYLSELSPADTERVEIPLAEVLPEPAGGIDTGLQPPEPPHGISNHIKYGWNKEIKAIAIIPRFELSTAKAREVLPTAYTRKDMIFNLQRLAVLTTALARDDLDPQLIFAAMQDRVHQPYRKTLIPGLTEILASVTPESHPGLLGICLSGAGPTILALATDNFESIANEVLARFAKEGIACDWKLLDLAHNGSTVEKLK